MRRISLSLLIPAIVLVVWGIAYGLFFWHSFDQNYHQVLTESQRQIRQFEKQMAYFVGHSDHNQFTDEDEEKLAVLLEDSPVERLLIIDDQQRVLMDSHLLLSGSKITPQALAGFSLARYQQVLQAVAFLPPSSIEQLSGDVYQGVQWGANNLQRGVVYYSYDLSTAWQQRCQQLYLNLALQVSFVLVVLGFLVWMLRHWFVSPLRFLTRQAHEFDRENGNEKKVKIRGELRELSQALKDVGAIVSDSQAKEKQTELYWQYALTGSGDGVWNWEVQTQKVIYSPNWCSLLGLDRDKVQNEFFEWESRIHEDEHDAFNEALKRYLREQKTEFKHIHRLLNGKGEYIWVLARGQIVEWDAEEKPLRMIGIISNINDYQNTRKKLEFHYSFDEVTGLSNRRRMLRELATRLDGHKVQNCFGALLYLDVDHFKNVNDLFDHHIGDVLLRLIAKRLKKVTGSKGLVGRVSGDEFAILLYDLGEHRQNAIRSALLFANQIRTNMVEGFQIRSNEVNLSLTIGISMFPDRQATAYEIFRQADIALYHGKERGRSGIHFFIEAMATRVHERHEMQVMMRQAMKNRDMVVYYQPRYNDEYQMVGAESLLRWFDNERGWISPGQFIPLAEESGFIVALGSWVMREACRTLKSWQHQGLPENFKTLSVNVSPKQFHRSRFVQETIAILEEEGCDPNLLELEITEGVLVTNIQETIEKIQQLRDLGIRFSVDDFGTGYSSLAYLNQLPINCLKIDKSFVDEVKADGEHQGTIISTIIAMSENLGLDVIAEGVETNYQLQFLKYRGCHIYQGFLFSQALEPDIFEALLFKDQ